MSLITITTGIGCGGLEVGQVVADKLNLRLYDDSGLHEEAINIGISSEDLKGLDEKAPGLLDRLFGHNPETYLNLMEAVIYQVASRGEGIIVGHGAPFLLRDFDCALHVRIYAPLAFRTQYLMAEKGLSQKAAERVIQKSDTERNGFLQFAFRMDLNDLSLYDVTVNRGKLGIDWAAELIMNAAQSEEIKACSLKALDAMENLALSNKVEAALLKNNISISDLHIQVPERGVVHIEGWLSPLVSEARVVEIIRGVPSVTSVKSEISNLPGSEI
jgi:cytidylate kinase